MPSIQRGQVDKISPGKYRLRWYAEGKRVSKQPFKSKSAAWTYYREKVEPQLEGNPARKPEMTFSEFVGLYLERHAADVRPRTVATLRERLRHAERRFGKSLCGIWSA